MLELTAQQTYQLELIVLDYLQGQDLDVTRVSLTAASARLTAPCKAMFKSIPLKADSLNQLNNDESEDPSVEHYEDPTIVAILASLNIKRSQTDEDGPYKKLMQSKNLYDLLKNLSHDGHHHVEYLLDLIEHTKPRYDWTLVYIIGAITSAGLGAIADTNRQLLAAIGQWFSETFPVVVTWLGRTFSVLRNIPLLGILVNSVILTWNWYSTFTNGTTTTPKKLQELFFKTLTSGLTISAYTLAFLAGGIITTPAALLFVSSSATKVIQGIYNWYKNSQPTPPAQEVSWEVQAEYARAENLHQRSKNSALVKIGAAILTTIAVAVWDFGPHSLVFTSLCVAFISMTALTEWSLLSSIKESAAYQLQAIIGYNGITRTEEVRPALSDVSRVNDQRRNLNLARRQFEIAAAERLRVLEEKELRLALRESHLEDQKGRLTELISDFGITIRESSTGILRRLGAMRPYNDTASISAANEPVQDRGEEQHFPSPLGNYTNLTDPHSHPSISNHVEEYDNDALSYQ